MIWIAVVVICELVVLVQLLMSCRTRAHRLVLAQNPIKQRMDKHRETLSDLAKEVRQMGDTSVEKLEMALTQHTNLSGHAATSVSEIDAEAFEAQGENEEGEVVEEEDEFESRDGIVGGLYAVDMDADRLKPLDTVHAIRHELEDTYEYLRGAVARQNSFSSRSTKSWKALRTSAQRVVSKAAGTGGPHRRGRGCIEVQPASPPP